jgi:hypothetical protein
MALTAAHGQMLTVKRGKELGFELGGVAQLVAFDDPQVKRLLHQVQRFRFILGQAQGKTIQRGIVPRRQVVLAQVRHGRKSNKPPLHSPLFSGGNAAEPVRPKIFGNN